MNTGVSQRIDRILDLLGPVYRFFSESSYARRAGDPTISDFAAGNPQELPLPGFADALARWSVPQNKDWYAYKGSEPEARGVVAESLRRQRGMPFEEEDIFLTNGAFAALAVVLGTIADPGDEVLFISPPWFFYEALIAACGARPVRVKVDPATFDLDLDAITAAIGERTRAIIVNSPNNPTGKIYPPETLTRLAGILAEASERIGRPIYLLSDEAYSRIIFDGHTFHSPAGFYPNTFVIYTYGKTLLTPGQRIGYIALPPRMPDRERMRGALFVSQLLTGYAFPNALLQHALPDLERLSIDVRHLQHKRDWMVSSLREMGYDLHAPEGTFYLLPKSPLADDLAFVDLLAEYDIFCLPGTVVEMPGTFRISLTASDAMIERALPGFAQAIQRAPVSSSI
ncbi:MAG TPA: aminotransferase class I/II-fold pyridoxal phosphate-dependent enzyme [Herpetosiphonaceae bacterium]|nr:aminotransferase class I/II-fold pyridoxal phosphate-dependent enzyme [Herpetosiphonaceae bacterium]